MTTSSLLSQLYPEPSELLKQQNTRLMQMLHTNAASRPTATSAPNARSSSKPGTRSACSLDPYLHRLYWLVTNTDGLYLSCIKGKQLRWASSANDVPSEQRYCTFSRAKSVWLRLRNIEVVDDGALAVTPVDFYAHRSTPHLWVALDD